MPMNTNSIELPSEYTYTLNHPGGLAIRISLYLTAYHSENSCNIKGYELPNIIWASKSTVIGMWLKKKNINKYRNISFILFIRQINLQVVN